MNRTGSQPNNAFALLVFLAYAALVAVAVSGVARV